jgi:hypothetical protein
MEPIGCEIVKKKLIPLFLVPFCMLILSVGCEPSQQVETPRVEIVDIQVTSPVDSYPTLEPYVFKTSEPGTATLHGMLLVTSPWVIAPHDDDGIFLVPLDTQSEGVSGIPEFVVGQVPQAEVDEGTGEFMLTNIPPGQYVVVVLTDNGAQVPASTEEGGVVVVTVDESGLNKTTELGLLYFP